MGRFGVTEILILLGIALLFFGGSRIASIGKGLGEGIKNFKKGIKDGGEEEEAAEEEPKLPENAAARSSSKASRKEAAPEGAEAAEKS
jgi:sec-independent protein translocase protein TatA